MQIKEVIIFFKKQTPKTVSINQGEYLLTVQPKETILIAALRENISFPHLCRIGGCGTCKCRLTSGQVKELTDKAYVLSEEELAEGYILACQSIPQEDVTLTVTFKDNA